MKYCPAIIVTIFWFSCNSPQGNNKLQDRDSIKPQQNNSRAIAKTAEIFKGFYTFGNEVNTFRDCKTGQIFWVVDSAGLMKVPYQKALQSFSYPNESAYAEVNGYLSGKSKSGSATEYENLLVVTNVVKIEAKSFQTYCYNFEFIAIGNEPFWAVDIIPNKRLIVFKDVAESKVYLFPYQPALVSGTSTRYQTVNKLKDTLTLRIKNESCSDGMSDNEYFHSAEVNINGKILKGCAIKKGDIIRQNQ